MTMVPFLDDLTRIETNLEILAVRIAGMTGLRGIDSKEIDDHLLMSANQITRTRAPL